MNLITDHEDTKNTQFFERKCMTAHAFPSSMKERSDALSKEIVGAAIEVHRTLGPGLLESAYEMCLYHELALRSISCERQVALPILYKGIQLNNGYKLDILVED